MKLLLPNPLTGNMGIGLMVPGPMGIGLSPLVVGIAIGVVGALVVEEILRDRAPQTGPQEPAPG